MSLLTERFASEALEFVSVHGPFSRAAGDGQTEPCRGGFVWAGQYGEELVAGAGRVGENSAELGGIQEAFLNRKRCRRRFQARTGAGEPFRGKDELGPLRAGGSKPCVRRE